MAGIVSTGMLVREAGTVYSLGVRRVSKYVIQFWSDTVTRWLDTVFVFNTERGALEHLAEATSERFPTVRVVRRTVTIAEEEVL